MKKVLFFAFVFFIAAVSACQAKKLKAMLSYTAFYIPGKGPYLESYLSVIGKSVVFTKQANGKYLGTIQVGIVFKKDGVIKYHDKYNLLSQEVDDTSQIGFNFLDQQRISLPPGDYTFELSISDKNTNEPPFTNSQTVSLQFPDDKINVSGIQLLESIKKSESNSSLSKNGYDLIPYVNNFYPPSINTLKFYAEVYNTDKLMENNPFLVSYYIEDYETKVTLDKYRIFSKQQPKPVNVVMSEFNITGLPSGNYNLVIDVRNNKNELLALKEVFFQRSSSLVVEEPLDIVMTDVAGSFVVALNDSVRLKETIQSFRPIANSMENNFEDFQLKKASLARMQAYVYRFWKSREPSNPEQAFKNYMSEVEEVNKVYKTPMYKGYETERGRVYLQYGPPNEIIKEDREPDSYPYEIWHYYKIKSQSNRKFVFYNTDLVTNDYRLLHSDMSGEVNEPQWQAMLHKRSTQSRDYENTKAKQNNFGEHSNNFGDRGDDFNSSPSNPK